ncbi:MAG: ABC transporter permease subunit [Fimbriimonadales bacterium]
MSQVPGWAQRQLGWRRAKDQAFVFFCLVATILALCLLVLLLWGIWKSGGSRLSWSFLTEFPSRIASRAGVKSALWGSIWIVALTGIISIPIGVAAAVYLEEFTTRKTRWTEFIQVNIANLAGVPSIVYGLLGLAVFVHTLGLGRSVISGALTMSLLVLPTLITVAQEALRAVPRSYREASLALGATPWQTIAQASSAIRLAGNLHRHPFFRCPCHGRDRPVDRGRRRGLRGDGCPQSSRTPTRCCRSDYQLDFDARRMFAEAAAACVIVLLAVLLLLNSIAIFLRVRRQRA